MRLHLGNTVFDTSEEHTFTAAQTFLRIGFGAIESITLSSDIAAVTKSYVKLLAQTSTTDDCVQITGLSVGDIIMVTADTGDTITMKDGANMVIGGDKALVGTNGDMLLLVCQASGKVRAIAAWADN